MLSQTSTSWFVCNPDYNKITLPGDGVSEIHQQAIDSSDSRSSEESVEFSVDSDKFSSESIGDFTVSEEKGESTNIQSKTAIDVLDTTGLTGDLEFLSTIHNESSKRVKRTQELGRSQRSNMKYTYFSTSEDEEDNIPSQQHVEFDENDETMETMKNDTNANISSSKIMTPADALSYKFKNYDYIKPISFQKYEELNSRNAKPRETPPEIVAMKNSKVKLPADYMEFNERRHPKDYKDRPTLMSGTANIKPSLSKSPNSKKPFKTENTQNISKDKIDLIDQNNQNNQSNDQNIKLYRDKSPPKPHDPTQDRPSFHSYNWKKIPNNPPEFLSRKVEKKERPPRKTRTMYKERKVKHMPHPQPEPIVHVARKKIPNHAPSCVTNPEKYVRKPHAQNQQQNQMYDENGIEIIVSDATDDNNDDEEEKINLPTDRKSRKQHLKEMLEDTEIAEWEIREAPKSLESDDDDDADDMENDFTIPDEFLTNEDEGNDFVKPKPTYFDPHETRAVRLRNQSIKQKLALKTMQVHLEEEDDDEREWKRKKVAMEIAPALKKLDKMTNFAVDDITEKFKRKEQDNNERAVAPLCAAIRSAKNTEFIVHRENKVVKIKSERNGKKHQKEDRIKKDEEEKLKSRAAKKKKLLQLWKI